MRFRPHRATQLILLLTLMACTTRAEEVSGQDRPSIAGRDQWITDFTKHTVPLEEITSGGPPKDGIRAIDAPRFVDIDAADRWLGDREPIAVVRAGGVTKAYPLQILIRHEIVNDVVGGEPITVTYCPLCNTTLAFDRRYDGKLLDFGTTGRLRHSDLVMYDRQTETWWQQATGEGIVGQYAGERLTLIPANVMSWRDVKRHFPEAQVLSRETGLYSPSTYGRSPYVGYDRSRGPRREFFRFGKDDHRLPAMERVVALEDTEAEAYLAVPFSVLKDVRVANVEVGSMNVVVFWTPGTASAVDKADMAHGRDVGSSTTFDPVVAGRKLIFEEAGDGRFKDRQTGTVWNLVGRAIEGELEGTQLTEVVHGNHFWFAWGVFRPETKVWRGR
ncbi:MAG: DUF3179 domain-containing protein [Gemmatimonadetes bacterium]|nr:DUF3179 domain-containing protein [Gemmatimonadota bacterium]